MPVLTPINGEAFGFALVYHGANAPPNASPLLENIQSKKIPAFYNTGIFARQKDFCRAQLEIATPFDAGRIRNMLPRF